MELLVGPLQESEFAEEAEFRLGREGDVNAGSVVDAAQLDQAAASALRTFSALRARPDQQPRPVAGVNGTATCNFG